MSLDNEISQTGPNLTRLHPTLQKREANYIYRLWARGIFTMEYPIRT